MGKGGKKTQVTTGPDAASQLYINQMREQARRAAALMNPTNPDGTPAASPSMFTGQLTPEQIQQAMNPYLEQVVGATRGEFDHLRGRASVDANQAATMAGAWGGSRHGVMEGARLGELDRAQASTIADLHASGYQDALAFAEHQRQLRERQMQEPLFRAQQGLNFMNLGMGPTGMYSQSTEKGSANPWGDLVAAGTLALGTYQTLKKPGTAPTTTNFPRIPAGASGGNTFAFSPRYSRSLWG